MNHLKIKLEALLELLNDNGEGFHIKETSDNWYVLYNMDTEIMEGYDFNVYDRLQSICHEDGLGSCVEEWTTREYLKLVAIKAQEKQETCCLVEMDHEDGRELAIVTEKYTQYDEFEAFDGKLIATITKDGDGECFTNHYQCEFKYEDGRIE